MANRLDKGMAGKAPAFGGQSRQRRLKVRSQEVRESRERQESRRNLGAVTNLSQSP